MKRFIIKAIDWFDDKVLGHRFYELCQWIGSHPWWGIRPDEDFDPPEPPKAA